MLQKISTLVVAGALAFAGCAHKEEKKDQPVQQETQPVAQPEAAPQPAPQPPPEPPKCTQTQVLDGMTCVDVAGALQGLRVEIPCKPGHKPDVCNAAVAHPTKQVTVGGAPDKAYDVTVRVRGVVELNGYAGGTAQEFWYVGGAPADKKANVFKLVVGAPAQTIFLNAGSIAKRTWPLDYTRTVRVQGGTTLTLDADSQDSKLNANRDAAGQPNIPAEVPPAPAAFDGQFLQLDVVSVAPAA